MSDNLTPVKTYLGKFYTEINDTVTSSHKYKHSGISSFFEQRYFVQNNKTQMIIDVNLDGLRIIVSGNEIHISESLYKHPCIDIVNSIASKNIVVDPRTLYSSKTFSTIAYLICQNHTLFKITGDIEEPIYITIGSDYEVFYNSVLLFMIDDGMTVNIVEEIESRAAINTVMNYILNPYSVMNVSTFYRNQKSAISFFFRNVIAQLGSTYNHVLLGNGSSNIVDENRTLCESHTNISLCGRIDASGNTFNSIIEFTSSGDDNTISVDYVTSAKNKGKISFSPIFDITGIVDTSIKIKNLEIDNESDIIINRDINSIIDISIISQGINDNELLALMDTGLNKNDAIDEIIENFSKNITEKIGISSVIGTERYYRNKNKFLNE